jgi:hypothetical protein
VKFTLGNPRSDKPTKLCAYCKKYGGAHNTHNTNECKKWDQHGSLKKTFKSKARSNSETPPGVNKSYDQLYAENKWLKASHKNPKGPQTGPQIVSMRVSVTAVMTQTLVEVSVE